MRPRGDGANGNPPKLLNVNNCKENKEKLTVLNWEKIQNIKGVILYAVVPRPSDKSDIEMILKYWIIA